MMKRIERNLRAGRALIMALLLGCGTPQAQIVQDLLSNDDFASNLSPWDTSENVNGATQAIWQSDSHDNPGSSGSIRISQTADSDLFTGLELAYQCIPVTPGGVYRASGWAKPRSDNEEPGLAYILVTTQAEGCAGRKNSITVVSNGVPGKRVYWPYGDFSTDWVFGAGDVTIPADVSEVRVALAINLFDDNDRNYGVFFDDLSFGLVAVSPSSGVSIQETNFRPADVVTIDVSISNAGQPNPMLDPSSSINSGGVLRLVSESCPGDMNNAIDNNEPYINWFNIPDIAAGGSIQCSLTAEVQPGHLFGSVANVIDCATCASPGSSSYAFDVTPVADIKVSLSADPVQSQGERVYFKLTYENEGTASYNETAVIFFPSDYEINTSTCNGAQITLEEPGIATVPIGASPAQSRSCTLSFEPLSDPGDAVTITVNAPSIIDVDYDPSDNSASQTVNLINLRVNSPADFTDDIPGDGICRIADSPLVLCTLRAAIAETNALPGHQTITLPYRAGSYVLNLTSGSDAGDLVITDALTLRGEEDGSGLVPVIESAWSDPADRQRLMAVSAPGMTLSLYNLELQGQDAAQTGPGGLIAAFNTELRLQNVTLRNGAATTQGGALWSNETARLTGVVFEDNTAVEGAALAFNMASESNTLTAQDLRITGNVTADPASVGGGLWFGNGILELTESSFVANEAAFGGGIALVNAQAEIDNVTLSGNLAASQGGGLWMDDTSELVMAFTTVADNEAGPGDSAIGAGGGLYVGSGASAVVRSSIFDGNAARTGPSPLFLPIGATCFGTVISGGQNTRWPSIQTDSACDFGNFVGDNNSPPTLGPLTAGQYTDYHAVNAVGNEIDQGGACTGADGLTLYYDQRGRSRPVDGDDNGVAQCDRGAVEMLGMLPGVSLTCPASIQVAAGGMTTFTCQVTAFNAFAGDVDLSCGQQPPTCSVPVTVVTLAADGSATFEVDVLGDAASNPDTMAVFIDTAASGGATAQVSVETTQEIVPLDTVAITAGVTGSGRLVATRAGIDCPGDCSGAVLADSGDVAISVSPDPGWAFSAWTGDCAGSPGVNPQLGVAFCTVDSLTDHTLGVTLVELPPRTQVSVQIAGSGQVVSSPAGLDCTSDCSVGFDPAGGDVTLTATPDTGWTFEGWQGDCSGSGDCVLDRTSDRTVSATFVFDNTPPGDVIFGNGFE